MDYYRTRLTEKLKEALTAVLPIIGIVLLLSFTIAPIPSSILLLFIFGAVLLVIGMMFFTLGGRRDYLRLYSRKIHGTHPFPRRCIRSDDGYISASLCHRRLPDGRRQYCTGCLRSRGNGCHDPADRDSDSSPFSDRTTSRLLSLSSLTERQITQF